ncbi:MAG TPA: hypothetical protein VES20_12295 [Bryobacteraceae bacterium]|nr:hypothetical protein [Bryobacteraceae bacterium]
MLDTVEQKAQPMITASIRPGLPQARRFTLHMSLNQAEHRMYLASRAREIRDYDSPSLVEARGDEDVAAEKVQGTTLAAGTGQGRVHA